MTNAYTFILGVLAVWRLTHLLNAEDGPLKIFARLREMVGASFVGELLDCFYCLSLWVAAPFAFLVANHWQEGLLLWPALSGAAILLERMNGARAPHYFEEPASPEIPIGENR